MKNMIYKLAIKIIVKRLETSNNKLTPAYLSKKGFVREWDEVRQKFYFVEENIKERDKVSIEFENRYYRVWHGKDRTFIAIKTSIEWFEMYMRLVNN